MHQFCLSHVTGSSNSGRLEVLGLPAFVQSVLQVLDLHTRCAHILMINRWWWWWWWSCTYVMIAMVLIMPMSHRPCHHDNNKPSWCVSCPRLLCWLFWLVWKMLMRMLMTRRWRPGYGASSTGCVFLIVQSVRCLCHENRFYYCLAARNFYCRQHAH